MPWGSSPIASIAEGLGTDGGTSSSRNTTGADRGVLFVGHIGASPTVADSFLNTWDLLFTHDNSGFGVFLSCYRTADGSTFGPGHTITVTKTGGLVGIAADFWAGGAASSIDDQESSGGGVFGDSVSPGSITPTVNGTLILCGCVYSDNQDLSSIDGGFVTSAHAAATGSSLGVSISYLVQTTATAANPLNTLTGNATHEIAGIANFKAAAAGGGGGAARPLVNGGLVNCGLVNGGLIG
jgi:hypothetical protein